jgi:hypothetical protein
MSNPEHRREIQITFNNDSIDDYRSFHERQFRAILKEMYYSGNYNNRFIPGRKTSEGRIVDAVHIVSFDIGDRVQLFEFIPGYAGSERDILAKLLKMQLHAYDVSELIDVEIANKATEALREKGLHVIGGFQLGTFDSGVRSVEIIYPEIFAELTGSDKLAADISALYLMNAHEAMQEE